MFGPKYEKYFDPKSYLISNYTSPEGEPGIAEFVVSNFHKFWNSFKGPKNNLTILEFGGGPTIHTLISACPFAKEIIFSEYTQRNREQVEAWLKKEEPFHDWSPFFKHVVQKLEGKSETEAIQREEDLRKKISCIVPCDIQAKNVVPLSEKKFDVVSSTLCIGAAVNTDEDYQKAIQKLAKLLKPGGHLILIGILNSGCNCYVVGDQHFYSHLMSEALIRQALDKAGVIDVQYLSHKRDEVYTFYFVSGVVN